MLVGILVFVALDDRISKAKWLTKEEKELLERQRFGGERHQARHADPPGADERAAC